MTSDAFAKRQLVNLISLNSRSGSARIDASPDLPANLNSVVFHKPGFEVVKWNVVRPRASVIAVPNQPGVPEADMTLRNGLASQLLFGGWKDILRYEPQSERVES